ncbi:UDP-N-acetylmuramate dehydrogenase [Desulfovibrionales bacterium]
MKHLCNVALHEYCSYRIGGMAQDMYFPETREELVDLVRWHRAQGQRFWIHGGGANTLFPDGQLEVPIISTSAMTVLRCEGVRVSATAGKILDAVVRETVRHGLSGMECLSGIPGTVGGALFMNAGAYGQEVSDHVQSVTILTPENTVQTLTKKECAFAYRQAQGLRGAIILEAEWALVQHDLAQLQARRKEILATRKAKQPLEYPSAGSVFKRPNGAYASQLIDQAGLKGARIGGAQVSEKHAGFIINIGGATCQDVLDLVRLCQDTVRERFGYDLELEQCLCPGICDLSKKSL